MVQNSFSVAQINGCVSESNSDVVETVIGWLHHLSLCLCCNSVFVRYDACIPTILLESLPFNLSTMNSDTETSGILARHRGLTWRFPKRVKQRLRKSKIATIATHLVPTACRLQDTAL